MLPADRQTRRSQQQHSLQFRCDGDKKHNARRSVNSGTHAHPACIYNETSADALQAGMLEDWRYVMTRISWQIHLRLRFHSLTILRSVAEVGLSWRKGEVIDRVHRLTSTLKPLPYLPIWEPTMRTRKRSPPPTAQSSPTLPKAAIPLRKPGDGWSAITNPSS